MASYLPLLPFFAKYPFIRVASLFLDQEYPNIIGFLQSEGDLEVEAKKTGKDIVLSVFDKATPEINYPQSGFLCSVCDSKECKAHIECEAVGAEIDWSSCDLCGECFKNCTKEEDHSSRYMAKKSVLSYLFSRLLVSCLDDWVRRKYAVKDARRYRKLMENEDPSRIEHVVGLFSADFGIESYYNKDEHDIRVHVSSYLKAPSKLKDENWRLLNQELLNGYVEISTKRFIRLVEEYLKERLEKKLNVNDEIKELLEPYLKEIIPLVEAEKKKAGRIKFKKTDWECFPPCMSRILQDLQSGVNISHTARFAITSFLLNINLDVEQIISLFSSAPDFNEEKTRYQVEHIAGDKGTEYACPACDTMKTYHNCYAHCNTYHPLSYYEYCMRRKEKDKQPIKTG
ncbi:MAG: DNA primase large subunit PriL [Archaeoglobaceae archaeon]